VRLVKGRSGNLGGRPKVSLDVQEAARAHTRAHTRAALATLARVAADATAPPAAQVAAANALLHRAWGRPTQLVEGGVGVSLLDLIPESMKAADATQPAGG
jgi:hypothetical protein